MSRHAPHQNLDDLPGALTRAGLDVERHRMLLDGSAEFFRRYARLEKRLLGEVPLTFPAYLLAAALPEDPIAAGERLAELERPRLRLDAADAADMRVLLDRLGYKVYRPEFPIATPLEGFFLFDKDTGPVFAVNGRLPHGEDDFILARLYGHFLADHDPYEIHLVLHGRAGEESARDLRAQAFAAAFLVERERLIEYLSLAGHVAGAPITPPEAWALAVYFEVAPRALVSRLLTLGLLRHDQVAELLTRLAAEFGPTVPEREPGALPERFLRLALEAHARGVLTIARLAAYLETDPATARKLASRFVLDADREVPSGDSDDA